MQTTSTILSHRASVTACPFQLFNWVQTAIAGVVGRVHFPGTTSFYQKVWKLISDMLGLWRTDASMRRVSTSRRRFLPIRHHSSISHHNTVIWVSLDNTSMATTFLVAGQGRCWVLFSAKPHNFLEHCRNIQVQFCRCFQEGDIPGTGECFAILE